MKLILVRHGETEWVRKGIYQGSSDVPLNALGLRQARLLARAIRRERPFAVYSSELMRVRETARVVAKACGKRLKVDRRLNEISFGKWEGHFWEDIRREYPKDVRLWYRAKWSSRPSGGESLESLFKRVSSFFCMLKKNVGDRDGACVVVTHGGPIRMFLIWAFRMAPRIFWSIRIDPASLHVFEIKRDQHEVVLLNSRHHLNGLE